LKRSAFSVTAIQEIAAGFIIGIFKGHCDGRYLRTAAGIASISAAF
jgi:hypothetical protein